MRLKKEQIFPTVLIALQAISAIPYLKSENINSAVYWIAAAVLNIAVTYKF